MISRIYRLVDTKRVEMCQEEINNGEGGIIVCPDYLSICAADMRYYMGKRSREILDKKLPMSLIHEATATVMHDSDNMLTPGSKVILLPLNPAGSDVDIKENYRLKSIFASSGSDGFMRDIMSISRERIVPITDEYSIIYVFTEILSVALGAIKAFEKANPVRKNSFGVWGDGSLGFVMSLALKCLYPESEIYIFGKNSGKLRKFSFASDMFLISRVPKDLTVDNTFECAGGKGSEHAISQMIEIIRPQGIINLLGVSEEPVLINTRAALEKGLSFTGSSRSNAEDFIQAAELIRANFLCRRYLQILISQIITVKTEDDIAKAFEQDLLNDFKTVMHWMI